jgi:hypothetical protein
MYKKKGERTREGQGTNKRVFFICLPPKQQDSTWHSQEQNEKKMRKASRNPHPYCNSVYEQQKQQIKK